MSRGLSLEEYVLRRFGRVGFKELKTVYDEVRSGRIVLIDNLRPNDFLQYLVRLDYSLWFWVVITLTLTTLVTILLSNYLGFMTYLRYVLGSVFVLFIPGYVTVEALYPKDSDLSPLERLALSIGLSLALVPLIGLVLNYTPWGIRLEPVITSLTIYDLIVASAAVYRKYLILGNSLPRTS